MIRNLFFRDFKSFREGNLPLAPLTLMIGANASGKSNAIEAVRFLSWLAQGRRLDEILERVQEDDPLIRGTIGDLTYLDRASFELGCESDLDWDRFRVRIQVHAEGMRVVEEEITSPSTTVPLYKVVEPADRYSHEIQVQYNNFAPGRKPRIPCSDQQAVFTQIETPARFSQKKAQREIPRVVGEYRRFLEDVLFLDPSPRRMRQYSFKNERRLKGDGSNLSSVVYALCQREADKTGLLEFIRALPEQDIRDLSFVETPRNEVMVQLRESFAERGEPWDAAVLSDGTLRVLAVAAALLSAPEGSLVIIEEIDNGVHPSRAEMLLGNIKRVAEERRLKVLLSTHNPALLDSLPAESVPDVICCYRDPEEGDSRTIRLEDLRDYPELVARGPLGQLMTRGVIDRYLKTQRSEEERKRRALSWLDSLDRVAG